jgi:hypothetical protein
MDRIMSRIDVAGQSIGVRTLITAVAAEAVRVVSRSCSDGAQQPDERGAHQVARVVGERLQRQRGGQQWCA